MHSASCVAVATWFSPSALQHQDMDVFPETWPLRGLIEAGTSPARRTMG